MGEYTRATMVLEELGIDPDDVTVDDFRYNNRLERYLSIYFFSIRIPDIELYIFYQFLVHYDIFVRLLVEEPHLWPRQASRPY